VRFFLPCRPVLSNDIYRYLWEGRVSLSGENPFSHAPEDPALANLRDNNYENINHKDLEAIYPPLAQGVFAVGAALKPSITVQKIIFVLLDLMLLVLLVLLLAARKIDPARCVMYAWNPLVVIEFAHSGHLDSLGMLFLFLGILLMEKGRCGRGIAALSLSFLSKYSSGVLAPYFLFKKRYSKWLALSVLVVLAGYLPFAGAAGKLISSLKIYALQWEFNSASFTLLRITGLDTMLIRRVLFLLLAAFSLFQGYKSRDFLRYSYLVIGCALLLSPTVYPWYVCWIVPFLCFYPNRAWIIFTGLVTASYSVVSFYYNTHFWVLDEKVLLIEYIPFYFLMLFGLTAGKGRLAAGTKKS